MVALLGNDRTTSRTGPRYVGTPSCAATCTASVSGVSGIRNPETRNPLPPWSAGFSPGSPPIEEPQTGFGDAPTLAWPLIPYAPAAPYRPHSVPARQNDSSCRHRDTTDAPLREA